MGFGMGTLEIAGGGSCRVTKWFGEGFLYFLFFFPFEEGRVNCQTLNIYRFYYNSLPNAVRTFPDAVKQFRLIQPSEQRGDGSREEILLPGLPALL